jgi:hypothetical protein
MDATSLIYLGDLRVTVALAGGVTICLVMARAYRAALWWSFTVAATFGAVAASKIFYLGWGLHSTVIDFKAASGHAAGAAAVLPIVFFIASALFNRGPQTSGLLAGWTVSCAVTFMLVHHGEHTASEALAGWCVGTCASAIAWRKLRCRGIHLSIQSCVTALIAIVVLAICVQNIPVGWWLVRTALMLSGATRLYSWEDC